MATLDTLNIDDLLNLAADTREQNISISEGFSVNTGDAIASSKYPSGTLPSVLHRSNFEPSQWLSVAVNAMVAFDAADSHADGVGITHQL